MANSKLDYYVRGAYKPPNRPSQNRGKTFPRNLFRRFAFLVRLISSTLRVSVTNLQQLIEHSTGVAEVTSWNPAQAKILSGFISHLPKLRPQLRYFFLSLNVFRLLTTMTKKCLQVHWEEL